MATLYDHYKHPDPWEQNLPADLIPPIKHLRKIFEDNHWTYGQITEKLCYSQLHLNEPNQVVKEYLDPLQKLKIIVGIEATQRFIELIKTQTAPAIFKAFFDLYLDGMTVTALAVFHQLAAVGKANERRLGVSHLEWAETHAKNMIRSKIHLIEIWTRNVCDRQLYDPNEDTEEQIFWRKWQAPRLIFMKPARHTPYDPERNWERLDTEDSRGLPEALATDYVLRVEIMLEKVAGQAALELAKRPPPHPVPTTTSDAPPTPETPPTAEGPHHKHKTARQEVRKLVS
jgi:hypothetical protein